QKSIANRELRIAEVQKAAVGDQRSEPFAVAGGSQDIANGGEQGSEVRNQMSEPPVVAGGADEIANGEWQTSEIGDQRSDVASAVVGHQSSVGEASRNRK